jgi:hypothetical protein
MWGLPNIFDFKIGPLTKKFVNPWSKSSENGRFSTFAMLFNETLPRIKRIVNESNSKALFCKMWFLASAYDTEQQNIINKVITLHQFDEPKESSQ